MRHFRFLLPALLLPCLTASTLFADPAILGLSTQTVSPVIVGGTVPLNAYVYNLASPGANALNYSLTYTLPDGSQSVNNGSRAADAGNSYDFWSLPFNTANSSFGINAISVSVSDPSASDSPQIQQLSVNVLNHARPGMWINGTLVTPAAQEPSVDPLAFGATGGGESFASSAPNMLGDPPPSTPTAELDLDYIHPSGDPQITLSLAPFTDLPADDSPAAGDPWQILVDASHAGTYTTFFTLGFSDEQDLPGDDAPGSVPWLLEVNATVSPDLSTVTGSLTAFPAPEPGSLALLSLAAPLLLRRRHP